MSSAEVFIGLAIAKINYLNSDIRLVLLKNLLNKLFDYSCQQALHSDKILKAVEQFDHDYEKRLK